MSEEDVAAAAADADAEATEETGQDGTAFDAERAKATIATQRKAEKDAKARIKELEASLEGYTAADLEKIENEKEATQKLTERDALIDSQAATIQTLHVQHDFLAIAASKGIADPALAFLAAKEQGLLGAYDPKLGKVGDHDWDELGVQYPSFASATAADSGNAGTTGRGKVATTGQQFNQAVRGSIRG
jgi:hypothetical protein